MMTSRNTNRNNDNAIVLMQSDNLQIIWNEGIDFIVKYRTLDQEANATSVS